MYNLLTQRGFDILCLFIKACNNVNLVKFGRKIKYFICIAPKYVYRETNNLFFINPFASFLFFFVTYSFGSLYPKIGGGHHDGMWNHSKQVQIQSRYYDHFQANILGKGMNPLILQTVS